MNAESINTGSGIAARNEPAGLGESHDIDWDTIDVGERADKLPLRTPGRMPLPARIAFVITVLFVLTALAAGVIALVV